LAFGAALGLLNDAKGGVEERPPLLAFEPTPGWVMIARRNVKFGRGIAQLLEEPRRRHTQHWRAGRPRCTGSNVLHSNLLSEFLPQ
jgi:hypothetical protein